MKKVYKIILIILIILFYVFMFWGLVNIYKTVLHKNNKCNCNCNCTITTKPIEIIKESNEIKKENEKEKQKEKNTDTTKKKTTDTTKKKNTDTTKKKTTDTTKKKTTDTTKKTNTVTKSKNDYQKYAHDLVINTYKWSESDFTALVKLWDRESGWNPNAHNKSSGAHGIPQSLPASKMKSEGSDYYTNGYTQIRWGLKYIKNRYGTPSKAWQHFQNKNWY